MFDKTKNKIPKDTQKDENTQLTQIDSLQSLQEYNINSLNYINELKTSNYDQLISRMYINFNLDEDSLNENDLTESNIRILTNIYNKISGNNSSKEKKKKNNKGNKDGMGLLLSLDVKEPLLLYYPYTYINKDNNIFFKCFLYSINISINNDYNNIGFIFPISLGESFKIKLINRKNHQIMYAILKKEKIIELIQEQMINILNYHYCICGQLLKGKKNIEFNSIQSYMKNLNNSNIYKKYFFVPIKKRDNQIEINEEKISKCINYIQEKCPQELFPRISEIISNINDKEENRKHLFKIFEDSYFVTDYKINRIYKFEDIIFKDDNFNTFINKYTFNNEETNGQIKTKLLEVVKNNNLDIKNITAENIMEDLIFEENNIKKDILGGIIGYRKIPEKYKIKISNENRYYLSCKFGSLNIIKKTNYIYNTNILKANICKTNNKLDSFDNSQNEHEKYAKILPPDRVFSYFLDKNDVELFEIIPSIFLNFEEFIKIPQFIKDYELMNNKSIKGKKFIENNYLFLQWAFTLHMYLQDYNYETLETLGDSILKMLATILVYHVHEINDIETDVGELVYNRATIICNLHLFSISLEKKVYFYLLRYPKEITGYTFPLEHEFMNTGRINITEKILADIIESSIGGIFLTTRSTKDCFNYIKKLDIPFVEKKDKKYKQTRGVFAKETIWKNNINYDILVNKAFDLMREKMENFDEFIFPEKINDVIKSGELEQNITLIKLMEKYLLKCNEAKCNYKGDVNSLDYLQKCRIFYNFKNIHLLEQAMTHKSKNCLFSKNYEKLELLGDSIVESFISQYTFCIFGPYLFEDSDDIIHDIQTKKKNKNEDTEELIRNNAKIFNNKYMTHIKSYLCSNYFMCKLSILIGLPKFIQFGLNDINNKNKLEKFLGFENVTGFFESHLNSYVSTEIFQPKFVADLFEALIGAIYIDSDLKTTYDFLHLIYGPSICYSCLFLKELPFSIVADFTERCSKEIKIVPSFRNVTKEEIINNGINFDSTKAYLKLNIGQLFSCIDKGDNEEKAKEILSEKGILFLDEIRFKGPSKN